MYITKLFSLELCLWTFVSLVTAEKENGEDDIKTSIKTERLWNTPAYT